MKAEEYVKHYASGQGGYESVPIDIALRAIEYAKREAKEQMMKDAIDGDINYWNQSGLSMKFDKSLEKLGFEEGMKVKVLIIKE